MPEEEITLDQLIMQIRAVADKAMLSNDPEIKLHGEDLRASADALTGVAMNARTPTYEAAKATLKAETVKAQKALQDIKDTIATVGALTGLANAITKVIGALTPG